MPIYKKNLHLLYMDVSAAVLGRAGSGGFFARFVCVLGFARFRLIPHSLHVNLEGTFC